MVPPSSADIARAWFAVGTQSVGGGPSTLFMIRRVMVDQRKWLTQREFLEDWVLSRLSIGIHLIAMAGLIGARLAGARGVATAVLAMILPACVITALVTAGYGAIRDQPLIQAAFAGAGPATAGLAIGLSISLVRTAARRGWRGVVDWGVAGLAVLAGVLAPASNLLVIGAGIVGGALLLRGERMKAPATEEVA